MVQQCPRTPAARFFGAFFGVLLLAMTVGAATAAERRIAAVIGIADYANVPDLKNTLNDSALITQALEDVGFEVFRHHNVGLTEFRDILKTFSFKAETADVALVYFAGHGLEVGGKNFLVPADSDAKDRREVAETSVSLDEILSAVDRARQLRIVILDSCRNDPFVTEGEQALIKIDVDVPTRGGGLAPPTPGKGTLVAFAARAGDVALDGDGVNSPFATALAQHLKVQDLEIGLTFRRVRDSVLKATSNYQEPHTYGSLSGDPYFLAGRSQAVNTLDAVERRNAWSVLEVDQEQQLAALAGEGDARALKGLAYMRLDPNEKRYEPAKAAELLKQAADAGDAEAMFELGRLLETGVGVEQDVAGALELFHAAAEAGFADAINDLGFLSFQGGMGVPRDPNKAIGYFERAADLRHPEALFNFAALIDDGLVPGKGPVDAGRYLFLALRSGNEHVLEQLSANPTMFKRDTRVELQKRLSEREFYVGTADGIFGPQTRRGLERAYGIEN